MKKQNLHIAKYTHPISGCKVFSAYDPLSGSPVSIINDYILTLSDRVSFNSLSSHFYALKKFYEYLGASLECLFYLEDFKLQPAIFTIIKVYPHYLAAPVDTSNQFFSAVRKITEHEPISKRSISTQISHINVFFKESHFVSKHTEDTSDLLKFNHFDLHSALFKTSNPSRHQIVGMKTNTVLGAVIRKSGMNNVNTMYIEIPRSLKHAKSHSEDQVKAFPFDRFIDLIKVSNLREKLLYTIIGGCGLRTHEAIQIRLDDFDDDGNLLIRDYSQRKEIDQMDDVQLKEFYASKGRKTANVFWIPGYEAIFRSLLKEYLGWRDQQLKKGGLDDHRFLFVTSTHEAGRPFYETQRTSHIKTFNRYASQVEIKGLGKHSLRHMYGIYMLNYFPSENGKGLSLQQVNMLMGHSTIKATEVYAQIDKKELYQMIENANAQMGLDAWIKSIKK